MKKIIPLIFCIIIITSCKKNIPEPPTSLQSNTSGWERYNEYYVTFFSNNFYGSPLGVTMNGDIKWVTYAYNYNPECSATGCANFTLPPGTYPYSYQSNSGNTISGKIITGATQCITILIN